jgi:hypothetical protein
VDQYPMSDQSRSDEFPYVYYWKRQGRKGQRCRVIIRAKVMNSCLIEFDDGYTMVTSRNAIRKALIEPER